MCGARGAMSPTTEPRTRSASGTWTSCTRRFRWGLRLSLALCGVTIAGLCMAATATWDGTSDPTVAGYRLYRAEGTCALHGYFTLVQTYGVTTSGPVPNPATGGTYCHFLTAFNGAGESGISNYAEFVYPSLPQCPDTSYCRTLKGQARKQCLACK